MKINESTSISLTMAFVIVAASFSLGAWGRWVTISIADAKSRVEFDERDLGNVKENQLISCQLIRQVLMNQGDKNPEFCVTVRKTP